MGGSKNGSKRNLPSNLIVLCHNFNTLIESDAKAAQRARAFGYKLESWQDPLMCPVWDALAGRWVLFDNDYGSIVLVTD